MIPGSSPLCCSALSDTSEDAADGDLLGGEGAGFRQPKIEPGLGGRNAKNEPLRAHLPCTGVVEAQCGDEEKNVLGMVDVEHICAPRLLA